VPILIDGDKVIAESDLIYWYIAEKYQSGTQLIPDDPFDRLRLRWFVQSNAALIDSFYGFKGFRQKSES
jgi:glutathione S-transferase